MNIGKNWKVEADELNVTLFERHLRKKDKQEYWVPRSYYSSVKNALHDLVNIEVLRTGLKDLETVNKRIDEVQVWISEALGTPQTLTKPTTIVKEAPKKKGVTERKVER